MPLAPVFSATNTIFFRVDGNAAVGLGHLVRCQAVAQSLHPTFSSVFILRDYSTTFSQELAGAGIVVLSVPATVLPGLPEAYWLASQLASTAVIVLDGYDFIPEYQRILSASGVALVCLDDLVIPPIWAEAVLNQAGGVSPAAYLTVPLARLYLGPAYALLRPPFWQQSVSDLSSTLPRLFLNMGGADPSNHTLALLPRLRQQFPSFFLEVVTGAAYPHQSKLQAYALTLDTKIRLHQNLSARDLATLLQTCQVFVCPPSGVAYECCAAGGAVLLHRTADNQAAMFDFLVSEGLALSLAEAFALPETELLTLANQQLPRQRALFDGRAAERLQAVFQELAASQQYQLCRATAGDAKLYFAWANDPAVRQHAIHPEPIVWETHAAWFSRRLQDTDSYLYVLSTAAGEPVGQVRVEFDGDEPGLIDYSIAPAFRGQGLGSVLLGRALQRLRHERLALAGGAVLGQVKAGNVASARVFKRLRFMRQAAVTLHGEQYEVFRLDFPPDL